MVFVVNECDTSIEIYDQLSALEAKLGAHFEGSLPNQLKLKHVLGYLKEMNQWARDYDYGPVRANGFRCLLDAGLKCLKFAATRAGQGDARFDAKFETILDMMDRLAHYVKVMRARTRDTGGCLVVTDDELLVDMTLSYAANGAGLVALLNDFAGFEADGVTRLVLKTLSTYLAVNVVSSWRDFGRCFYDGDFRARMTVEFTQRLDIDVIRRLILFGEIWWVRVYLPFLNHFIWPSRKLTLLVPRQTEWQIGCHVAEQRVWLARGQRLPTSSRPVRCRLLAHPSGDGVPEARGWVVFHVHGGGFVAGSPDSHEIYTRGWANHMPGSAILSVDYSLTPEARFPVPLQELLDVYLWLTSGSPEVEAAFGFRPRNIVLVGDSCGSNLVTTLLVVLNDMRKAGGRVLMPRHLVGFYAVFSLRNNQMMASYLLTAMHPFLTPQVILCLMDSYIPQTQAEYDYDKSKQTTTTDGQGDVSLWARTKARVHEWAKRHLWVWLWLDKGCVPWYAQGKQRILAKAKSSQQLIEHPYLSPMYYEDFESMRDIQLTLVALNMDPTLDQSIEMARRWRGKVDLDVVNDMPHAFLNFVSLGFSFIDAYYYAIDKMKNICEYNK
ncbi:Hormone-sensitive lipase [Halotydeus destructor]|nr:Hormone-sensitive lipase [Halotydeus destructor]